MNGNNPSPGFRAGRYDALRVRLTVAVGRVELLQRRYQRGSLGDGFADDLALVRTSLDEVVTEVNLLDPYRA